MKKYSTIKIIGEKEFQRICKNMGLNEEETEITKEIIEAWDECMKIEDFFQRMEEKIKKTKEILKRYQINWNTETQKKILTALWEITRKLCRKTLGDKF